MNRAPMDQTAMDQTPMDQARIAALGVVAVVTAYVVERHYLQIEWVIGLPVPVVWWVLGAIVGVLGMPLLLTALGRALGRQTEQLDGRPVRLLVRWVLPLLVAHVAWLGVTIVGLRRFNAGFTSIPARNVGEVVSLVLLPPPELSLLWSFALAPVVVLLTRRLPTGVVVVALTALTLLTTAPTFLVFLVIGMRLGAEIDGLAETATWRTLVSSGAVALVGAAALSVPRFPVGLGVVVAGLAVLPFALTLVALLGARRRRGPVPGRVGPSAVAIYLLLIPVAALFDKVLVARLGYLAPGPQYVVALVEPLVIVAVVVAAGVLATALVRRVLRRTPDRRAAARAPGADRLPVLAEVDR